MVEWQLGCLHSARQRLAIQPLVEDGADRAVGSGTDLEAASARGFEPVCAVLAREPQDAEASAEALFGMGPTAQDHFDQAGGVGSDGGGVALDALVGPAGVAARSTGAVLAPSRPVADRGRIRRAVEDAGYTGLIEAEIFSDYWWAQPIDRVLATCVERYRTVV